MTVLNFFAGCIKCHRNVKDEAPSEGPVLVLVDNDIEVTVERRKSRGVEIITEPRPAPWQPGRTIAEFRDSEGNRMVITSR